MKQLMIFFLFFISLALNAQETESLVIKIGKKITIYNIEDSGNSNYWGEKVSIKKSESTLPEDSYLKNSGAPKQEWEIFMENQNGVYYSVLEKSQKDYSVLRNKYQQLLKEGPKSENVSSELKEEITKLKNQKEKDKKGFNKKITSLSKENEDLTKKYKEIFSKSNKQERIINVLKISLAITLILLIFLIKKIIEKNKKIKILDTDQRVSNLSH
jgi:hypothetical protein